MKTKILHDAAQFKSQISKLKSKAPIYPKIHFEESDGYLWATTMVKFTYNGVDYKRHHVESIVSDGNVSINELQSRLVEAAEMCIKKAVPCQFDDVIGLSPESKVVYPLTGFIGRRDLEKQER